LFRHYDSEVQGRTWRRPGEADAVVIRVDPGKPLGIAFAVGGDARGCGAAPEQGARHAVAEAARHVAATGARPWALTDCLNFGDAEDASVMGDLEATIDGLAAAATALGGLASPGAALPFVSGNVSLYNHSGGRSIPPTPIVMCAGVIDDVTHAVPLALARAGDTLLLVGERAVTLAGSDYARVCLGDATGGPPPLDLEREARLERLAVESARAGWAGAAHAVGRGGVAVAVTEMLLAGPREAALGVELAPEAPGVTPELALFGEAPAMVFAATPEGAARLREAAAACGVAAWTVGRVTSEARMRLRIGDVDVAWDVATLGAAAAGPLERLWNEDLEA
jgi:phosphoribosylformylglycinamidine synthase